MPWWGWLIIVSIIVLPFKIKVWKKMFASKSVREED